MEALAVGIRRQTDTGQDVVSLARLLDSIRINPHIITRERFRKMCAPADNDEHWQIRIDANFDEWAGAGNDQVDPDHIQKRLDALDQTSEKVTTYVNKQLAHADIKGPPQGFTFTELDEALDEIGRVLTDFNLLLTCVSLTSPDPAIQVPWQRAFVVPWASPEAVARWHEIQAHFAARNAVAPPVEGA